MEAAGGSTTEREGQVVAAGDAAATTGGGGQAGHPVLAVRTLEAATALPRGIGGRTAGLGVLISRAVKPTTVMRSRAASRGVGGEHIYTSVQWPSFARTHTRQRPQGLNLRVHRWRGVLHNGRRRGE